MYFYSHESRVIIFTLLFYGKFVHCIEFLTTMSRRQVTPMFAERFMYLLPFGVKC